MIDQAERPGDSPATGDVTRLLRDWQAGDTEALNRLVPLVYRELHRIAERQMRRERRGHTLQPSAVVNETYLKLVGRPEGHWQNRVHFFAVAARAMRQILVDHARRRAARKRGAPAGASFIETVATTSTRQVDVLAVDEALNRLSALDAQQAEVVEMRFFAGLTVEEVATALDISAATVHRKWAVARAWLHRELVGSPR